MEAEYMIISGKALKGSLKKGGRAIKNKVCHGPIASAEFTSKTNFGCADSEMLCLDYKGRIAVMKKGIVIAHLAIIAVTVGYIVCVGMKNKRKGKQNECECD